MNGQRSQKSAEQRCACNSRYHTVEIFVLRCRDLCLRGRLDWIDLVLDLDWFCIDWGGRIVIMQASSFGAKERERLPKERLVL